MNAALESQLEVYFAGCAGSRALFETLRAEVAALEETEIRVTKSQVAFRRKKAFAWAWVPGRYLRRPAAPLVLTLSFLNRDLSSRWKQVVEPYPGRFMHHLELYTVEEMDDQVRDWLRLAWALAG